jgi:hypothetical protein
MPEKKVRRTCSHCGVVGEVGVDIFWMTDPYIEDVEGEVVKQWLHEHCADEIADEI